MLWDRLTLQKADWAQNWQRRRGVSQHGKLNTITSKFECQRKASTEQIQGPQCPPPRPELEGLWWVPLSLELQLYMAYTLSMVYEGHSVRDKTKIMWRCHVCVSVCVYKCGTIS